MAVVKGIKLALFMEQKGTEYYLDFAIKSDNPLTKRLFYSLAAQEIEHARVVDDLASGISSGAILSASDSGNIESGIRGFWKKISRSLKKLSGSQEKIYETAMNLERKSYDTYKILYDKSSDSESKKIYKALMDQESAHLEALENVYNYLTRNGDWFEQDESRVWNWMNM